MWCVCVVCACMCMHVVYVMCVCVCVCVRGMYMCVRELSFQHKQMYMHMEARG